jgi:hypothetical protein
MTAHFPFFDITFLPIFLASAPTLPVAGGLINNNQIRLTQSTFCKIENNQITNPPFSINDSELGGRFAREAATQITSVEISSIYTEDNYSTFISQNEISNGFSAISCYNNNETFIGENVLKAMIAHGIVSSDSYYTDIFCNNITVNKKIFNSSWGVYMEFISDSLGLETSLIRNNCIFEANRAISVNGSNCGSKLPIIFNNFLYNYQIGIEVYFASGSIGNDSLPGRNTFVSNNAPNGSIDVVSHNDCQVDLYNNYGIFNLGANVNVVDDFQMNSTASCANQITEFTNNTYNLYQEASLYSECKPMNFSEIAVIEAQKSQPSLSNNYKQAFANWPEKDRLKKLNGVFKTLYNSKNYSGFTAVYNTAKNSNNLSSQETLWLNYFYNFVQKNYSMALQNLSAISSNVDENLEELVKLEKIKTTMLLNKTSPRDFDAATLKTLNQIFEAKGEGSKLANDYLKLAIDGHDYPFRTYEPTNFTYTGKVKTLQQSTASVWPNPAENEITIDYILVGEEASTVYLYDLTGRIVHQEPIMGKVGKANIGISKFSSGAYIINIKQGKNNVHQSKLIKK